jgi:hypothetical protein
MKKLLLIVLAVALVCGTAYAGQNTKTLIDDTLYATGSLKQAQGETSIAGAKKVSFFVTANGSTDTVSSEVSAEISYNGTDWLRASFRDFAGGATLQTEEVAIEGDYYMWLDTDYVTAPYVRINVSMAGAEKLTTDNQSVDLTVTIVREQ